MESYGSLKDVASPTALAQQSAFRGPCLERLDNILGYAMFPQKAFLNIMMSSLKLTTKEKHHRETEDPCYERYVLLSVLLPAIAILMILYFPVFCIAFVIWMPIQRHRKSYRLTVSNRIQFQSSKQSECGILKIASIDTRLLTEYKARWNENLGHTQQRATRIAQYLVSKDELKIVDSSAYEQLFYDPSKAGNEGAAKPKISTDSEINESDSTVFNQRKHLYKLVDNFPQDLNVVCLQGVFDERAEKILTHKLSDLFPYVISNVTVNSWRTNHFQSGSGLVLASQLPVLKVDFHCFIDSSGEDRNKAKGFLVVELDMGQDGGNGYKHLQVINTELQKGYGQREVTVRCHQLSQIEKTVKLNNATGSDVILEVVCGNLQFDNVSVDEKPNWSHPLFDDVIDPCAVQPGEDHHDVIGTELKVYRIYDDYIATPESMKRTLLTCEGQREFLEEVQRGTTEGATDHVPARRTNRILYKQPEGVQMHFKNYLVITKLAGLTTYLPVSAEIVLSDNKG